MLIMLFRLEFKWAHVALDLVCCGDKWTCNSYWGGGSHVAVWYFMLTWKKLTESIPPLMCWRNTSSVISFKYKSPRSFHAATIGNFRHRAHHLSSLWPMQMHSVFPKHCGDSWNFKHWVWQSRKCLMLMSFDSRATPPEYWCTVADVW